MSWRAQVQATNSGETWGLRDGGDCGDKHWKKKSQREMDLGYALS